ncbi:hypothetical protein GCM10009676_20850 [Prauserella halophila]|uniref:Uncharacterized protein n=1 Tax=Prauserella halophila TaxID=185641 RepID=A0ABP4GYN2_9PSEU|nr:hypothetical protein [Prauserella halophila]
MSWVILNDGTRLDRDGDAPDRDDDAPERDGEHPEDGEHGGAVPDPTVPPTSARR